MCLGIPGQIMEMIDEENQIAKVDVAGVRRNVNVGLLLTEGVSPGDWILITWDSPSRKSMKPRLRPRSAFCKGSARHLRTSSNNSRKARSNPVLFFCDRPQCG